MATSLPPLPPSLKSLAHYLKVAVEHDKRDPVVSYWCRLYALQTGMGLDKSSTDAKKVLMALMDRLEKAKQEEHENEAIITELVGQAHMEEYALKIFLKSDNDDRASRFSKNLVKTFYTAAMLFDVLSVFGEINEEFAKHKKYARWKASYIHQCLKNGETPVPGPMGGDEEGLGDFTSSDYGAPGGAAGGSLGPAPSFDSPAEDFHPGPVPTSRQLPTPAARPPPTQPAPTQPPAAAIQPEPPAPVPSGAGVSLTSDDYAKATKFCKFGISAISYEDASAAIENLQKALMILQTGRES